MNVRSVHWAACALLLAIVLTLVPISASAAPAEQARVSQTSLNPGALWTAFTDLVHERFLGFFAPSSHSGGGSSANAGPTPPSPPPQGPTDIGTVVDPNGCSTSSDCV